MQNFDPNFNPYTVDDKATALGHAAQTPGDRIATLRWCLANAWAGLDIGKLERSDTDTFHGWLMWPYLAAKAA